MPAPAMPPRPAKLRKWRREDFAGWLLDGLASWYDPNARGERDSAFLPGQFDPDWPPVGQITRVIDGLGPRASMAFRSGIVLAVGSWTDDLPPRSLLDLLELGGLYRPVDLPRILRYLILHDLLPEEEDSETPFALFATLCAYDTPEVVQYLDEIRAFQRWRPSFGPIYAQRMVALDPTRDWLALVRGLEADFLALSGMRGFSLPRALELVLLDNKTLMDVAFELPRFDLARDGWIVDALFHEQRGRIPLAFDHDEGLALNWRGERLTIADIEAPRDFIEIERAAKAIDVRLHGRRTPPPEQPVPGSLVDAVLSAWDMMRAGFPGRGPLEIATG